MGGYRSLACEEEILDGRSNEIIIARPCLGRDVRVSSSSKSIRSPASDNRLYRRWHIRCTEYIAQLSNALSDKDLIANLFGFVGSFACHQSDEDRQASCVDTIPEQVELTSTLLVVTLDEASCIPWSSQETEHVSFHIPKRFLEDKNNLVEQAEAHSSDGIALPLR